MTRPEPAPGQPVAGGGHLDPLADLNLDIHSNGDSYANSNEPAIDRHPHPHRSGWSNRHTDADPHPDRANPTDRHANSHSRSTADKRNHDSNPD